MLKVICKKHIQQSQRSEDGHKANIARLKDSNIPIRSYPLVQGMRITKSHEQHYNSLNSFLFSNITLKFSPKLK